MTDDLKSDQPYRGPERRKGEERREGADRREEIRFEPEPDKGDRRVGKDRRKRGGWDGPQFRG